MEKIIVDLIKSMNPAQTILILICMYFMIKNQTKIINGLGQRFDNQLSTKSKDCQHRHSETKKYVSSLKDELKGKLSIIDFENTFKRLMENMSLVRK